jgi:hypothetical protein
MSYQVQRAIVSCGKLYPELVLNVVDHLYHAFWVDKFGIQALDTFKPIFEARLGSKDAERVIQMVCLMPPPISLI